MHTNNYLYLVDDKIMFYNQEKNDFLEYKLLKKTIEKGKIINYPKFLREFKMFLKQNKVIKKFKKNSLTIITPPHFYEIDKEIIKKIFDELPFQEIKMIKEINIFSFKKNILWINLNTNYAILFYQNKNTKDYKILEKNYLNKSLESQINIFLTQNPKIKKIYIYGNNSNIPEISKQIESKSQKVVLYFESSNLYLFNKIIRHN